MYQLARPTPTRLGAALCAALFLTCAPAIAQQTEPSQGTVSRITVEVSNEIYSPFCPGKTLMMCPSPNAAKVRRDIQDMVREGKDKETIKNTIVATYGEEFRVVEPPKQDNVGLFVALAVGLLLAIAAVLFLSRRKRNDPSPSLGATTAPSEAPKQDDLSDEERQYLKDLQSHISE